MSSKILSQFRDFSSFFFFFIIIIYYYYYCCYSFLGLALAAEPADCEPQKYCGNIPSISYPFWLNGKQPSYCGYPPFEINCRNNTPVLRILSQDYYIKDINYKSQSVLVINNQFLDHDCWFPPFNLTLGLSPFISISTSNKELFFFSNCTRPKMSDSSVFTCAGSKTFAYLGGDDNLLEQHLNLSSTCVPSVAPILGSARTDVGNYSELLKDGFLFSWSETDCSECRDTNGTCGYDTQKEKFMCICADRTHLKNCSAGASASASDSDTTRKSKKGIVTVVATGVGGFIFASALCILVCLCKNIKLHSIFSNLPFRTSSKPFIKKSRKVQTIEAFLATHGSLNPKRYKYSDVKKMTKSFSEKLGQGGYGTVFKGKLRDGRHIAVKILTNSKGNGEEFVNEVASIGKTSHINIVSLLGFCSEASKRALIYEFMPNGSLEKYIYVEKPKTSTLGCEKLYEIAIGIARGLEYLHRGCNTRIVHFDIKPHNILLDQDFCPKIADFGLAKLCSPKQSILSMQCARGTAGYIAPEVFSRNFGVVSSKADVYSYGMMILEMVGGRNNIDVGVQNTSEIYFPHWIYEHLDRDGDLQACGVTSETEEIARKMILVGLWCIQTNPGNRPSMSRVVEMLEGSIGDLQMPPKPYISSPFTLGQSLSHIHILTWFSTY